MNISFKKLKKEINQKGINLTHQRWKVLEYLYQNKTHPTVDQIFNHLQKEVYTISKTTVYNTLRILAEAGLVRIINIEDNETRYDIELENHGHFKCQTCGEIFNFRIDTEMLVSDDLKGFRVDDRNVYFKGTCPNCIVSPKEKL